VETSDREEVTAIDSATQLHATGTEEKVVNKQWYALLL